jgi:hypothetical protein
MITLRTKICSDVEKPHILPENTVHSLFQVTLHVERLPKKENRDTAPLPDVAVLLQRLALGTTSLESNCLVATLYPCSN